MDAHRGKPEGTAVTLSVSLSAFVDLFEFFTDTISDIRKRKMAPIGGPWREYFGEDAPPFEKVLDETTLSALEFQLRLLILLTETKLEELAPRGDDPFALSDEATRYRKRAESKLMDLYYRIHSVRSRLGHELVEDPKPSPRIQSESGLKLDLMLEREEPADSETAVEEDVERDDETVLEVNGFNDQWADRAAEKETESPGDEQSALTDKVEDIIEQAEVSPGEESSVEEGPETTDGSIENDVAEPSSAEESARSRFFKVVSGAQDEATTETSKVAGAFDGDEIIDEDVQTQQADIREFVGPKLVSTEQMVGAGRYDDFDLPDKEDREDRDSEADSQQFESAEEEEDHVEPEELKSLEVPPASMSSSNFDDDDSIPLFDESSSKQDQIDALMHRVSKLKKVHRDAADLKVKTAGGAWTLSLPYFSGTNGNGDSAALLDIENFIGIHNLAFRGVLDAATKNEASDSDPRITKLVQKLHVYFRRLYANVSAVIGHAGSRILGETGDCFEPDVFLLLEADLVLFSWKTAGDVREFRDIFQMMISKPFNEYMTNAENKLIYLESIIELLVHGDERNSAKG